MIAEKILRGLSALHEKGLVHADVKPSNCMMDAYGSLRLIDFGSAFRILEPATQPSWTPRYAPPEVLEGQPFTPKSDLASVGYMLSELISGRPGLIDPPVGWDSVRTFDAKKRLALAKAKRELFNRLHELIPDKDLSCHELMELFRKLIHPDPEKRFENLDEALKQTDSFRNVLVQGGMSLNWCQVFKFWVRDVQAALARLG
jgi:serine/threonine-protein kinase